jgi:hypothetical protein
MLMGFDFGATPSNLTTPLIVADEFPVLAGGPAQTTCRPALETTTNSAITQMMYLLFMATS